jgi:energy-coupling factor transporter transmembrane protein EcfT
MTHFDVPDALDAPEDEVGPMTWEQRLMARVQSRSGAGGLTEIHLLRYVPHPGPIHRLWAGTKLIVLTLLSVGVLLWPGWRTVGIVGVVLLIAYLAARLPRGIVPRIPKSLVVVVGIWGVLTLVAGGPPIAHLGPIRLGLGGFFSWVRLMLVGIELLFAAALLGWTTPLADLSPAFGRLFGPLRHLKVPVDELVGAIALAIRCLPLLFEEVRVLRAARIARRPATPRTLQELGDEAVETIFGALANAIRRARELAEAIEARGGVPTVVSETHALRRADALAFAVGLVALVGIGLLR